MNLPLVGDDRFYDQTLFPFSFGNFDYDCFECLSVTIGCFDGLIPDLLNVIGGEFGVSADKC